VLQTVDVGLGFVDFSSQRGGFQLGIFQPAQPADHVIAHIAQSSDQLTGLGGIPFTHSGIVSPVGAPGTLNRAAARGEQGRARSTIQRSDRGMGPVLAPVWFAPVRSAPPALDRVRAFIEIVDRY
jgi:hypothetical protein